MIKEALEYLAQELGRAQQMEIDGRIYTDRQVFLVEEPSPHPLTVTSLTAVVQYLLDGPDELPEKLMVHVRSPHEVAVYSPLSTLKSRDNFLRADAKLVLPRVDEERPLPPSEFQIVLRTAYLPTEDRDVLLKLTGNVVDEEATVVVDDGVSQQVTIRSGVASRAKIQLPNPVVLKPYCSFPEIEQPEIPFIFRMHKGPLFSLHEAGGGAWRKVVTQRIFDWLRERLDDTNRFVVIA